MDDAFQGDDSVPDIWTNSEAEIWMDIDEDGFGAGLEGPWLSGVDALYTDGDSDVPEPLESEEMNEGGEPDEPTGPGVFTLWKKWALKKGNLIV